MEADADPQRPWLSLPPQAFTGAGTLGWHSASLSDIGYVRTVNEDAHLDSRENRLWVVADGMGGHSFGDQASQIVVDQMVDFRATEDIAADLQTLEQRLIQANEQCRCLGDGNVMGSTVVALYCREPYCFFLWAGDSRIYRYRDARLEQMTEDHSLVQELVSMGEIRREEMEKHPSAHIITRAVGVHHELKLEIQHASIEPGDRFLICSDGLYKDLDIGEIAAGMASSSVQSAVRNLVDNALQHGGSDNTTAIVVQAARV